MDFAVPTRGFIAFHANIIEEDYSHDEEKCVYVD